MAAIIDKIYEQSPVWAQNIGISLFGYHWQKRRFGGVFEEELRQVKLRESYTSAQWRSYQTRQLRQLLLHAWETVPFYRAKYNDIGLSIEKIKLFELEDLSALPFLEKDELRQYGTTDLLSSKREKKGAFYSSSGSTGTPTQILFSEAMHQRWSAAFEARIRHWAGLSRKDARGMIGGRRVVREGISKGPFYRYNFFEKQVYFSAYHLSAATAPDYLEGIRNHQLQYMTGYAMSNYFLARFIEESGLSAPPLKAVITSSEKLTNEMRETFKRVYHCKSYDSYSGVEACGMISENEHGQLLVSPDVGIIEILKEDGSKCAPGETGEAVCTGLINYDQPLIRYRIGDLLCLGRDQSPKCGRNMPVIDEISGRIEDTVIGLDGREMVRFHGIFVQIAAIVEGQIIQHTLRDFEIRVVVSKPLKQDEIIILQQRMRSQLGDIILVINETETISRNQNGKFKAVISHVKRDS